MRNKRWRWAIFSTQLVATIRWVFDANVERKCDLQRGQFCLWRLRAWECIVRLLTREMRMKISTQSVRTICTSTPNKRNKKKRTVFFFLYALRMDCIFLCKVIFFLLAILRQYISAVLQRGVFRRQKKNERELKKVRKKCSFELRKSVFFIPPNANVNTIQPSYQNGRLKLAWARDSAFQRTFECVTFRRIFSQHPK